MTLTLEQLRLLETILEAREQAETLTVRKLAERVGLCRSVAHRRLQRLRQLGLVQGGEQGTTGLALVRGLVRTRKGHLLLPVEGQWSSDAGASG